MVTQLPCTLFNVDRIISPPPKDLKALLDFDLKYLIHLQKPLNVLLASLLISSLCFVLMVRPTTLTFPRVFEEDVHDCEIP